jgi:hypothetical protein
MQENFEYIAQRGIKAPGTMVWAYQRGDGVPTGAVENWELAVGEDGDVLPVNTGVVARPEDDADRTAWEAYVIGQGTSTDEARAMSLDDLRGTYDPDDDQPVRSLTDSGSPQRPADSDKKAAWVAYVTAMGADESWANASDTTKADLMNWQNDRRIDSGPEPAASSGDPIAENAGELANG